MQINQNSNQNSNDNSNSTSDTQDANSRGAKFYEITQNSHDQRLDNFLLRKLKGVPKSFIYKQIRKGQVRINGKRCKPLTKLNLGDMVRVAPLIMSAQKNLHLSEELACQLRTSILWETSDYLILNKPAGLASHAGGGVDLGAIEAMQILRNTQDLFLAHRLDKGTSGCLLLAKNRISLLALQELYKTRDIQKSYLALVVGNWDPSIKQIDLALSTTQQEDSKLVIPDTNGKNAVTNFTLLANYAGFSLIQAQPITGRTHQIRVHCQAAGFPILGDAKYGIVASNHKASQQGFKRLFLHSESLAFKEPVTQTPIEVKVAPDKNWQNFLQSLVRKD